MPDMHPQEQKKQISFAQIRPFLIRGLLLILSWKLLYIYILKPKEIPDYWLTKATEYSTAWVLKFFYAHVSQLNHTILINNINTVIIAPECNGLELFVLYIGFILCIPTDAARMIKFSVIGIAVIYILNVLRAVALAIMAFNQNYLIDFAHHYAFKLVIYAVVFWGWLLYVKTPVRK